MKDTKISDSILYVGVDDHDLDLFESQYEIPSGVSYNSYIIMDEKITIMDTVDGRAYEPWIKSIETALGEKEPTYLVISHMEPDHSANIRNLALKYPNMKLVGNAKTFNMLPQFFENDFDIDGRKVVVAEGETLELGTHTLTFVMAPMVHWPEVMVAYESSEKILFSADGFGKFGTLDTEEPWEPEAARYYYNIVGKYGIQVQSLLKKAAALDIQMICPLHGPILKENLGHYIDLYQTWSSYTPEEDGVLVVSASIHGNTAKAAEKMAEILMGKTDKPVEYFDLTRGHMSQAVRLAFKYSKMIVACATYDGGMFPCMEDFLRHLKAKNYQKRTVGMMENGSWAPVAAKQMLAILETMKDVNICENTVTIKSAMKPDNVETINVLADELLAK